jgi:hypothetical protein
MDSSPPAAGVVSSSFLPMVMMVIPASRVTLKPGARISKLSCKRLGSVLIANPLQQHINELLTEASDRFDPPGIGGEREPHA